MPEKPILSICIPTVSHSAYLQEAIESVLEQVDDNNKDKLEIVISDNASTDDTKNVVENLAVISPIQSLWPQQRKSRV